MRNNLKMYKKVNLDSSLKAADPHTVILMLFNGTLENISIGKGAIERKNLELKSTSLSKAINILRSLQHSLDKDSEPQVSKNFDVLYSYCINQLISASENLNTTILDSIVELLMPLRDAWKNMPEAGKQEGIIALQKRDRARTTQSVGV